MFNDIYPCSNEHTETDFYRKAVLLQDKYSFLGISRIETPAREQHHSFAVTL